MSAGVLKGEKAADPLPVQPKRCEPVINLKATRALGPTIADKQPVVGIGLTLLRCMSPHVDPYLPWRQFNVTHNAALVGFVLDGQFCTRRRKFIAFLTQRGRRMAARRTRNSASERDGSISCTINGGLKHESGPNPSLWRTRRSRR
jgi:hypothetical protein